jgi:hypothetical protein
MDVNMKTCSGCGEELDDDLKGPCPDCGATGTTATLLLKNQTLTLNERGICTEYAYGTSNPWQEQWANVRDLLKEIERYYQPGDFPGDRTVKRNVKYFFLECFHLGDWLWEDKATKAKIKEPVVKKFILADRGALEICEAVANTSKHHTRRDKTLMTAWVHSVTHNQAADVADAVIKWKKGTVSNEVDALELAKGCYRSWRAYQKANGLKTLLER